MTIQTSGVIGLSSLRAEFPAAGSGTVRLSQFYRNGGIVPGNNTNVPTSGLISLGQFYGATNRVTAYYTLSSNSGPITLNYWDIPGYVAGITDVIITVNGGVWLASNSTGVPALTIGGNWHAGTWIHLVNHGAICGMGGAGANTGDIGQYIGGNAGGPGLNVNWWITVSNYGWIAGGGGGGGAGATVSIRTGGKEGYYVTRYGGGGGGGRSGIWNSAGGWSPGGNSGGQGSTGGPGASGPASVSYNYGGAGGDYGAYGGTGLDNIGNGYAGGGPPGPAVQGNGYIAWNYAGTRYGAIT